MHQCKPAERRKSAVQYKNPTPGRQGRRWQNIQCCNPSPVWRWKAKERDDEMKCLTHATGRTSSSPGRHGGCSHNPQCCGNGQSHFRERGRGISTNTTPTRTAVGPRNPRNHESQANNEHKLCSTVSINFLHRKDLPLVFSILCQIKHL